MNKEQKIKKLYASGLSYRELQEIGYNTTEISKAVKGTRSISECCKIAKSKGHGQLTEDGRRRLSEAGKRRVKSSNKIWTKPEREFKSIINQLKIGVKFPEIIEEILDIKSDNKYQAYIHYQYPIQRYLCDYVHIQNKIIFRVQGDFWHANPVLYDRNHLTKIQNFNVARDKLAKTFFEKKGWNVIDVWESDIYWRQKKVIEQISPLVQMDSTAVLHTVGSEFDSREDYWSEQLRKRWFAQKKMKKKEKKVCEQCGKKYFPTCGKKQKCCSHQCANKKRRKPRPSAEILKQEMKEMSWVSLGKKYDVTGNAVKKWAKNYKLF